MTDKHAPTPNERAVRAAAAFLRQRAGETVIDLSAEAPIEADDPSMIPALEARLAALEAEAAVVRAALAAADRRVTSPPRRRPGDLFRAE